MEEKKVTVRLKPETHKLIRRRMEDEWGFDNFQKLFENYAEQFAAGERSLPLRAASVKLSPELALFAELLERKSSTAQRIVGQIEAHLGKTLEEKQHELEAEAPRKGSKSA